MPSAARSPSRPALVLLTLAAFLGWGIAGYAFIQRDNAGAQLAQTEAARAALATDLEHQKAAAGQVAELQQKLAAAEAALAQSQAAAAQAAQQVTALTADVAARTHERDVLQAQVKAAPAAAAAESHAAPETHATPVQKPRTR